MSSILKSVDTNVEALKDQFLLTEETNAVFNNLTNLHKKITHLYNENFKLISKTKNKDEILHLFYIRDFYSHYLFMLEEGIVSANLLVEFLKLSQISLIQKLTLDKEDSTQKKTLAKVSGLYFSMFKKFKKLNIFNQTKESELDHLGFALYILDEYYFNKEKVENSLWSIAIENSLDEIHRSLPNELMDIQLNCLKNGDEMTCVKSASRDFSSVHEDDKSLIISLCYLAKILYDCHYFKCSFYFLDRAMKIMEKNNFNSKKKYFFFNICKGLIYGKLKNYDEGYKIFLDSIEFLRSKEGQGMDKDILIGYELLNVGCILTNWGICDVGVLILVSGVLLFEQHLPASYNGWEEATILSARFYNDVNEFKSALKIAAPLLDYFHILNFGSIKDDNKPIYELAIEMSVGAKIRTVTRSMKYPLYLPKNIGILLTEMIISFSGLGDRSSATIVQNYMERCMLLSSNYKHYVIEHFDYSWLPNIEKVVKKMRYNTVFHDSIFNDDQIVKRG